MVEVFDGGEVVGEVVSAGGEEVSAAAEAEGAGALLDNAGGAENSQGEREPSDQIEGREADGEYSATQEGAADGVVEE
eukprot:4433699-Pyramimonas_sp.AAC.1